MATTLTDQNFQAEALDSGKLSVVDFWAVWCGPCRAIAPIIDELHEEYDGKAVIGKVDVDNNQETAMKYGVRSIPTIVFIKDGKEVDRHVGAASKAALKAKIDQYI